MQIELERRRLYKVLGSQGHRVAIAMLLSVVCDGSRQESVSSSSYKRQHLAGL